MKLRIQTALAPLILLLGGGTVWTAPGADPICPPQIIWDHSYGGSYTETLTSLEPTADGGFVATGVLYAWERNPSNSFGLSDVWVVRTDADGAPLWQRYYGGSREDYGQAVVPVEDGGFVVGATSASTNGNKTSPAFGDYDYWLFRLRPDGTILWQKSFGGTEGDYLGGVIRMPDGGFVLAGESRSGISGNKTSPRWDVNTYGTDLWIVRTDADGNKLWEQSYGGTGDDRFGAMVATEDGGILLGASSLSDNSGNKTAPNFGQFDFWVLRLDATGGIVWQQSYGGSDWDELHGIARAGTGFLLGGTSQSGANGNKTSASLGYSDYWVVRINADGLKQWEDVFGGTDFDGLSSLSSTADGGFLLSGNSYSAVSGNKTSPWRGRSDYWVVRLDAAGQKKWEQSYGGSREDNGPTAVQTADGRFIVGGSSESYPRGNKTAPNYGSSDFWLVRLAAESPDDCDNDGVPNSTDQCPDTPRNDYVDPQGCGLSQACPCANPWAAHSDYVACVSSNSARLVALGVMTPAQRQSALDQAMVADCPPTPVSVLAFGLTNVVLGIAQVVVSGTYDAQIHISETGTEGNDGISVQVGQADSGVFIYPYAEIWGSFNDSWFMRGTAYGRVNGVTNTPIARMRGRKPYYETYPVEVDLSPLQPQSVTWQVWSGPTLVIETNVPEAIGEVTIYSASQQGPRANPFWRMPDGSVGAMIELTESSGEVYIGGPFGFYSGPGTRVTGDRIFARANLPANTADYVSKVDVVLGGGLEAFDVLDQRPGVFRRAHRVLGYGLLSPSLGRLQIDNLSIEQNTGVLIEAPYESTLDLTLEPVSLTNDLTSLAFSLSGAFTDASDSVGAVVFNTSSNGTSVSTYLLNSSPNGDIEVRVYKNGEYQGSSRATNSTASGSFVVPPGSDTPRVIGVGGGFSGVHEATVVSFTLDRVATFRGPDALEWQGNHFQLIATNTTQLTSQLSAVSILTSRIPSFAIINEDSSGAPGPIGIRLTGSELVLSWPARNLPIVLESSETLPGNFTPVTAVPVYENGTYRVTLPAESTGHRFFQLRTAD